MFSNQFPIHKSVLCCYVMLMLLIFSFNSKSAITYKGFVVISMVVISMVVINVCEKFRVFRDIIFKLFVFVL